MHDSNPISGSPQTSFDQKLENITGLPEQLRGDPQRQAVSPIQGFVYQAWWSIDAWLRLSDADEVIYLEGAEDFDFVKKDGAIAVQVKRNTETISLGTAKVHAVLENFWKLSNQEIHRRVDFHYLTTSSIAKEKGSNFRGVKGIEIWRAAQTNLDLVIEIKNYLIEILSKKSSLRLFLASTTDEVIQEKFIQRLHWITNQPDID